MVLSVKSALGFLQLAAVAAAVALRLRPKRPPTSCGGRHVGELGRQLEKLAADFNASQSEYRVVPSYKGNYTDTDLPRRSLHFARAASRHRSGHEIATDHDG